ncbi:hypothetical protein, partial [Streptobacillus moniliformis]|uniref:hypothetical protein n=1 Tax=Streptobacillus moniliformis TaxID=34105 RepID=UPI001E3CBF07
PEIDNLKADVPTRSVDSCKVRNDRLSTGTHCRAVAFGPIRYGAGQTDTTHYNDIRSEVMDTHGSVDISHTLEAASGDAELFVAKESKRFPRKFKVLRFMLPIAEGMIP